MKHLRRCALILNAGLLWLNLLMLILLPLYDRIAALRWFFALPPLQVWDLPLFSLEAGLIVNALVFALALRERRSYSPRELRRLTRGMMIALLIQGAAQLTMLVAGLLAPLLLSVFGLIFLPPRSL